MINLSTRGLSFLSLRCLYDWQFQSLLRTIFFFRQNRTVCYVMALWCNLLLRALNWYWLGAWVHNFGAYSTSNTSFFLNSNSFLPSRSRHLSSRSANPVFATVTNTEALNRTPDRFHPILLSVFQIAAFFHVNRLKNIRACVFHLALPSHVVRRVA